MCRHHQALGDLRGPLRKSRYFTAVGAGSDSVVYPGNLTLLKINFSRLHGDYPLTNQIRFSSFDLVINNSEFASKGNRKQRILLLHCRWKKSFSFFFFKYVYKKKPHRNYEIDVIDFMKII